MEHFFFLSVCLSIFLSVFYLFVNLTVCLLVCLAVFICLWCGGVKVFVELKAKIGSFPEEENITFCQGEAQQHNGKTVIGLKPLYLLGESMV